MGKHPLNQYKTKCKWKSTDNQFVRSNTAHTHMNFKFIARLFCALCSLAGLLTALLAKFNVVSEHEICHILARFQLAIIDSEALTFQQNPTLKPTLTVNIVSSFLFSKTFSFSTSPRMFDVSMIQHQQQATVLKLSPTGLPPPIATTTL